MSPCASSAVLPGRRKARVTAEHTSNRVRENQRRHRARQRDYVSSLEQKLAQTEQLLAEARAEVAALKAGRARPGSVQYLNQIITLNTSSSTDTLGLVLREEKSDFRNRTEIPWKHAIDDTQTEEDEQLGSPLPDFPISSALPSIGQAPISLATPSSVGLLSGPPPCCSDPPIPLSQDEPADPECPTCKTRPPPDPSESTTLCAQAAVIISQQNFRNLEPELIRLWLAQGLRRAQREGEGCRVENGALLRLLDYISGIWWSEIAAAISEWWNAPACNVGALSSAVDRAPGLACAATVRAAPWIALRFYIRGTHGIYFPEKDIRIPASRLAGLMSDHCCS